MTDGAAARKTGRIAVLGLGQIGGSLLQALAAADVPTTGFDTDLDTAAMARSAGYDIAESAADAIRAAEVVALAMPLPDVAGAVADIVPHLQPAALLTDVGTLKQPVLDVLRALASGFAFVGGHPLAGVEQTGWPSADATLFRGSPWALTLEPDTPLEAWLRMAELVCRLGARPVPTTAADQDAAVARVIGLPHVLAEALALTGLAGGPLGLSLAAGSYMSGSRVARTRPELVSTWCDGNPGLVAALDDAIGHLHAARDALATSGSVLPLARAGHRARVDWENRRIEQVQVPAQAAALLAHGRRGGWLTSVIRSPDGVQLDGMRPV